MLTGMHGTRYQLGDRIGAGGEGTVYAVQGTQLVAKLYKNPTSELEGKLRYMVQRHLENKAIPQVVDQNGNLILRAAWPRDILYDGNRNFAGYIMPRVEGGVELFQIERGCTAPAVRAKFPDYSWRLNVLVARNLAASVNVLHKQGYVLGDMNCKNFLVNTDGSISLLDTDSLDITDTLTGRHYKCCVGMEEYLPPELQGRNLRSENARYTMETDNFALAVHIFQLLMNNYHPFSARQTVVRSSSNYNPQMTRIVEGKCPYLNQYPDIEVPKGAPRLEDVLPQYMIDAFSATFDYTAATAMLRRTERTTAEQWLVLLRQLLTECDGPSGLVRCQTDPSHYYLRSKGFCGICKAQRTAPPPPPPPPPPIHQARVGDYFFDRGNEFFLTEEEARQGGAIAVYARGRKEYQLLPPYQEIGGRYKNIRIGKSVMSYDKLPKYSDGRLRQWSASQELLETLWACVQAVVIWIAVIAMIQMIATVVIRTGLFVLDLAAERIFHYDLVKTIPASSPGQLGVLLESFKDFCVKLPPLVICPLRLQVRVYMPAGLWDWLLVLGLWGFIVGMCGMFLKDCYSHITSVGSERRRRSRM